MEIVITTVNLYIEYVIRGHLQLLHSPPGGTIGWKTLNQTIRHNQIFTLTVRVKIDTHRSVGISL